MSQPGKQFVFLDHSGRRWPLLRRIGFVLVVLSVGAVALFVASLLVNPSLNSPLSLMKKEIRALQRAKKAEQVAGTPLWQRYAAARSSQKPVERAGSAPRTAAPINDIRLAHYVSWDPQSWKSLQAHARQLSHVATESLSLSGVEGKIQIRHDERVEKFLAANKIKHLAVLTNADGGEWVPEAVEYLAFGPQHHREKFFAKLVSSLNAVHAQGVLVDWQGIDPAHQADLTSLLWQTSDALRAAGLEFWLAVPVGDDLNAYDLPAIAGAVDRFVAVLHDENGQEDSPGPIASKDWYEGWLHALVAGMDPSQWVIELGVYGYDWKSSRSAAEEISFSDVMTRARSSEASDVTVEAPFFSPSFSYSEAGSDHTVWFLDGVTFANQVRAARQYGVAGIGIDRLGEEDPGIWKILDMAPAEGSPRGLLRTLARVESENCITHYGDGDVVSLTTLEQADGHRHVKAEAGGLVSARYLAFPSYPSLLHHGGEDPTKVALTFDDGPDPRWTPQVLDILKQYGVKAVFFVTGANAEKHPELLRRILREGHEIGSHTFTHSNLAVVSDRQVELELNATQRVIESATGRSTHLFRPPYEADSRPEDPEQLRPIQIAQDMGYLTVFERIDPEDWEKPGTEEIVRRVRQQREAGSIILLHDAGGDRSQTIAALPTILEELRERGDKVVPLAELLGTDPADLMPPVAKADDRSFAFTVSGLGFAVWRQLQNFVWLFIVGATVLVGARTILILILALLHARRKPLQQDYAPPLSIVVPAFKEGKVIAATLESLLASKYAGPFEIVVVDDGSPDNTAEETRKVAARDGRVRLLVQQNSGKAAALENGIRDAKHDVLVFLDADTQFDPDTLTHLVAPLARSEVGAVAGHPRVGNPRTLIARCQDIEYIVAFNLERRALSLWNAVTVVPGAVSAIRRQAIVEAGGLRHDTLAEDTDLTLAIHEAGWRVDCAPDAFARTEAPETVRALIKQRFRWALGTMQCVWKHRRQAFSSRNPALGWFSLPGIWLFQFLLVATAPFMDLLFLQSAVTGHWDVVLPYFAVFLVSDLLLALVACRMEKIPLSMALWVLPMRFIYRPVLSFVVWRATAAALKGAWVGWGKLDRTGTVGLNTPAQA